MQYETLDSLCKVASGGTPSRSKKEYWEDGSIPWIKIGNIKNKYVSEADEFITEAGLNNSSAKLFSKGTILYTIFATLGEVGILTINACTNQAIAGITIEKTDLITTDYLYYYLKSKKAEVNQIGRGVAQNNINLSILKKFSVPLRGKKEQEKIVTVLKHIEIAIENKKLELANLDNLVKARFVEMFGMPGANPKGWNEIKLGEVCDLQNGYAFKSSDYVDRSSVLNCRMSNIRPDGGFDAEYHPKYLPEEYWDKCSNYRLFDGDVIIAMTDMASDPKILGVPTIVSTNGKKFLLNQRVGKLSFLHDDRINRVYLMHSLGQKYIRKELAKSAAGSTQINVGKPAILNIDIYEPPRLFQNQFADFVARVDKSKFALSNELAVCNFYIRLIHDRVMHGRINL